MTDIKTIVIKKQIEDKELKWYVLSVTAGQEEIVEQNLKERIKNQNLQDDVVEIWNPKVSEVVLKQKKGKLDGEKKAEKVIKQKKMYPWYLFFKSKMNDKIWYIVRNTPGVRLIVGAETKPISLTDEEYQNMKRQVEQSEANISKSWDQENNSYKVWDVVKVLNPELKNIVCTIKSINYEKETVEIEYELLKGHKQTQIFNFSEIQ